LYNGLRIKFHESPAFLFTYDYIREEFSTTPAFGVFYKKVRKRFFPQLNPCSDNAGANVSANGTTYKPIGGKWMHSDHPRPLTKIAIADMPPLDNSAEYTRARAWARKLPHVGEACRYPINGKEALARFQSFCSNKLAEYGGRQNYAIINSNYDLDVGRVLFHSVCSSSLNIGLITPKQVATELLIAYRDNHARIPVDGFEIFFRQLMMREYMRVVYTRERNHTIPNYFNAQYNMSEAWYNGTTGMPPIDNIIRGVLRTGYAHNTVRANWLCGWMMMQGIKPMCIYEWFLTMCVDAYPWITIPCVGGAYGNIERGYLAIKSSTWLTNMSNLKRTKNISWHGDWDLVYCLFIHSNANKLGKIDPKIVKIWKDKPAVERRRILAMARELLIERVVNTVDNTQPQIQQAQIQQAQIQHPQTEPPQIQQPQTEPPQIEQKINKK
jgi:deoxyribodipyrimidine photolyase-related protein